MSKPYCLLAACISFWLLCTVNVQAGMSSFTLTEAVGARLDVLSFFVLVFVLCALILRWAWNVLARDFTWMPRIRFKQALAMMVVSGLFLYVVLTMISGARELMTPGAWVKTGLTYELAPPERDSKTWLEAARRHALEQLRDALWEYARHHQGGLPAQRDSGEISADLWAGVHPQDEPLGYMPGRKPGQEAMVVVFEPDAYGARRFCLLTDGTILKLSAVELKQRLLVEAPMLEVRP